MLCGYLFIADGVGDRQRIQVSFRGTQVYTSPTPLEGTWNLSCCGSAHAMVIWETRNGMTTYRSFVEGSVGFAESAEEQYILGCCATHRDGLRWEYRYALLGTGDYLQESATGGIETMRDFLQRPGATVFLTDGTQIFVVEGRIVTADGVVIDPNDPDTASLLKRVIVDTRQRVLFCNGEQISSNRRYDGLYCCGDYAICVYVDDVHLSGWKREHWDDETWTFSAEWKYTPHPGWGDRMPPAARDREMWDRYKSLYPGFKVDVFYGGESVGTFDLSDANSPIYYDKLIGSWVWEMLSMWYKFPWERRGIGAVPWALEGAPQCGGGKLLIPHDGGITTVMGETAERRVFV